MERPDGTYQQLAYECKERVIINPELPMGTVWRSYLERGPRSLPAEWEFWQSFGVCPYIHYTVGQITQDIIGIPLPFPEGRNPVILNARICKAIGGCLNSIDPKDMEQRIRRIADDTWTVQEWEVQEPMENISSIFWQSQGMEISLGPVGYPSHIAKFRSIKT